jgi:4-amino-4-deoxy-L-arabinose transferase-like glycosyltransferase
MNAAVPARTLARALFAIGAAALAFVVVLRLAVRGTLPSAAIALLAPVALLALVAATFDAFVRLGPLATDERGQVRPLRARHGFWVIALATGLSLPMLGAFSLVDPWETHYAEVAREMIERRDFVSPWWGHEGWFMSKPVLTFWLEAASMKLFGVGTGPNEPLATPAAHPEWAVRFPAFALAVIGAYVLYHGISRTAGRRAGLLGAIVLVTMPGYALLSHQALTDMPLVACTGASLGLLLRALDAGEKTVQSFAIEVFGRRLVVHAGHAVAIAVVVLLGPQIVGLALQNVHATANGLHLVADRVVSGSPHACGLPSQPACVTARAAVPMLAPWLVALLFLALLWLLVSSIANETRSARLFAIGAWIFAGLATMAKGPAGLVVPAGAALLAIASRRSVRLLLRLHVPTGLLVTIALVAPWYVAVFARHGRGFLDQLVLRHMLGRTLLHLHDTNAGEDVGVTYFVKQLGWATFPWTGLVAAAFASLPSTEERGRRGVARVLFAGATIIAFVLVSAMRTKFHHYVLVTLPPCAMVVGLWLDDRLTERRGRARLAGTVALAIAAACVVALVTRDLGTDGGARRFVQLVTYRYDRVWPTAQSFAPWVLAFGIAATGLSFAYAHRRLRRAATIGLGFSAIAFATFLLDVYLPRAAKDGGQRGVMEAYVRARGEEPHAPLVAYQLNWKGENFYTGNDLAIFVQSGSPMQRWIAAEKARGVHTFFFVTERGRVRALQSELGAPTSFEVLTDASTSYEFALVRASLQ